MELLVGWLMENRTFFGCSKCGFLFYVERIMGYTLANLDEVDIRCPRCKASNQEQVEEVLVFDKCLTDQEIHAVREAELISEPPKRNWWHRIFIGT